MNRTLIQAHATAIIQGFLKEVSAIADLKHDGTKGQLREMFVSQVLDRYLSSQFGIGSGTIVNQRGDQSKQTDIIIYDRRILPPFIWQQNMGVFPIESVVETIEVKSQFGLSDIVKADKAARRIREIATDGSIYDFHPDAPTIRPPGATMIGFADNGLKRLYDQSSGLEWLVQNVTSIWGLCLAGNFSWMRVGKDKNEPWVLVSADEFSEETKRYIAVVLDNARTKAESNYQLRFHRDWIGTYTRDNPGVDEHFVQRPKGPTAN